MPRNLRKGLVDLALTLLIAAAGFLLDQPETFGLGAMALFGLAQVRRVARDYLQGAPK